MLELNTTRRDGKSQKFELKFKPGASAHCPEAPTCSRLYRGFATCGIAGLKIVSTRCDAWPIANQQDGSLQTCAPGAVPGCAHSQILKFGQHRAWPL
jgi:hypothetical protein